MKNRPSAKKKHPKIGLLVVVSVLAAVIVAGGVGVYALGMSWIGDLTEYDVSNTDNLNTSLPSEAWDSTKTVQLAKFQLDNREPVELNQISQYVLDGTVATEDERFYEHGGFDLAGIARALVVNITGSGREGASTITQQFVRNTILSDEMDEISIKRKVREMYLSVKLEEVYSKDEILRMYLNTINYGNATYGIQAASQRYFSKDATDLTLAEAAALVGIPQSPSYNNPLVDGGKNCIERRNLVLDRMLSNGYITQEEHDAAQQAPLEVNETIPTNDGILAYPYFTSYMRQELKEELGMSEAEILKGGFTIVTTLDVTAQEAAEQAARDKAAQANGTAGLDNVFESAMAAVDPETGHIKALVGGRDYSESQVNLATGTGGAGRQSGSSFKTFTLVAAIKAGIDPQTLINCSATAKFPGWSVENINKTEYGTRSIARAFAVSSNTGFARLCLSLGPDAVASTAKEMGIHSNLSSTGSITLGVDAVTPLEMAEAYATLASGGVHHNTTPVLQVYNRDDELVVDNTTTEGERVLEPEVAHAALKVMEGVVQSSEGTGTDAALANGQVVAGKTGTSDDYKDSWFCGVTPQMSVAFWLGDRRDYFGDNSCESIPPSVTVASAFASFMNVVLEGQPAVDFANAANPPYKAYTDAKYGIGGTAGSSGEDASKDSDKKDKDTDSNSANGTNNGSNSGGTNGSNTPGGPSGGGADKPDPAKTPSAASFSLPTIWSRTLQMLSA